MDKLPIADTPVSVEPCGCPDAPALPQECVYALEMSITAPTLCRCCEQCRDLCAMEV